MSEEYKINHSSQVSDEKNRLIAEKQQAIRAEEDAVEAIFDLCEGLKSIEGMANNALHMATSHNMKIKLEEIAKTAKELRKK